MALCAFGGVNDQCGAASWALHETGMTPLLSCDNDMTAWLQHKYKGSGVSGTRGKPGDTKATSTGNSKYQKGLIHTHKCSKWLSRFRVIVFKIPIFDWLKISRGNLLSSCAVRQTFTNLFKRRAKQFHCRHVNLKSLCKISALELLDEIEM